jgi:hypothetical protein
VSAEEWESSTTLGFKPFALSDDVPVQGDGFVNKFLQLAMKADLASARLGFTTSRRLL